MRAVMLLSGGLDSLLAARVVQEQGIELHALNFVSVFCCCTPRSAGCSAASSAVRQLGIPLKVLNSSENFLQIVRNPKHGYGRNLNPCLDCRINMFRRAGEYMREIGAAFIVTGEVLGERPMSQRRQAMELIERESGLDGLILRPLSAALLNPSIPEKEGWVDRQKLLSIRGRCRKPQIELAREYGLTDYPCPAGGCLLTDAGFAAKMRDLMTHKPNFGLNDVNLLKVGRHFRLSPDAKAVLGRNEEENRRLLALREEADRILEPSEVSGPTALVRGAADESVLALAARLVARYALKGEIRVAVRNGAEPVSVPGWNESNVPAVSRMENQAPTEPRPLTIAAVPADESLVNRLRIGQSGTPERSGPSAEPATESSRIPLPPEARWNGPMGRFP